ncbi:Symplekin tight junction protein C terminal-domain-containing protein [Crepidotus variabilis]|uniref:Symplekin tight junction protein C terminal-domain-containing protein n=1 Tax=Crepidotus variabilis TaxID=179855 RepID=A0A9P6EK81_9AGAR|nr:Symplekin tight junction protein C terminal-domain-containing protein [Crepidotus variabilis]
MANNPIDPLQALQSALTAPPNSKEQADLLGVLRESLESHPKPIPILLQTLISNVLNAGDTLLRRWVLDLFHYAICRSALTLDQKTQLALIALEPLAQLIDDPVPTTVKVVVQCMATVYPLVFRYLCMNRANPNPWTTLSTCKVRLIDLLWAPNINVGVRLSAMKFVQRVVLVQTRGLSDPRLQKQTDPHISFVPVDHPFISAQNLEAEGQRLSERLGTLLYTSQEVDLLTALLNSWSNLVKLRPATLPFIIATLRAWTPTALVGLSASNIKSVEKGVRILLMHISRLPISSQYSAQISDALSKQAQRMEAAAIEEKRRKAALAESRKRPSSGAEPADHKRIKLENDKAASSASASFLSAFDFRSLPAPLITNLIVANLEAFTEGQLIGFVNAYRQSNGMSMSTTPQAAESSITATSAVSQQRESSQPVQPQPTLSEPEVKAEPVDPLQMDIDEEEMEYEPEKLNEELAGAPEPEDDTMVQEATPEKIELGNIRLPSPPQISEADRVAAVSTSLTRIWDGVEKPRHNPPDGGASASELWMVLIVRMITRVADPPQNLDEGNPEDDSKLPVEHDVYARQNQLRRTLCDYIMTDFPSRVRLATTWMNEEWYNDQIRSAKDRNWRPNYDTWLNKIVSAYKTDLDGKDKTFTLFLLDLPSIPGEVLEFLRDHCLDHSRMQIGYTTLRGLVIQRPAMRMEALNVLLELTTHPDRRTRAAAIQAVKPWVPHHQPMGSIIREFALQMLKKLQLRPGQRSSTSQKEEGGVKTNGHAHGNDETPMMDGVVDGVDGEDKVAETEGTPAQEEPIEQAMVEDDFETDQIPPEDLVQTPYLPEQIELPVQKQQVLQHVELMFALSVKVPEFLDEIFTLYGRMDISVQGAIQDLITPLVRSLGSSHGKLLTLMRQCPPGSESLSLRVLTIFTEHGRPSAQLVALVKSLINERDLDARFLIPIIAEMDKADIIKYLPRIVSCLNGQTEQKNLVRSVFSSIVTTPPQTFGSVTSNLPRVRQSELLTPAELMVLLHESEKEIGLKSAIEAIGICFSMTDVFRSEILAVVMQQIMDNPSLPVLFLRTVIQAVTTYKSLVGFVATTLLSRLITKKIWTNPPLWEGFIRCAKAIAPASFGALLQLPRDQLRELVDKQPSLKAGLRDYVTKKAPNKARGAGFLDIFGEPDDNPGRSASATPQPTSDSLGNPPPS